MTKKVIFIFLILISLFFSQTAEEKTINITAKSIENLIEVNIEGDLSNLIPNHEYLSYLTIKFAIPFESLKNIESDKVYVIVEINSNSSSFYFKKDSQRVQNTSLFLKCIILNDTCGQNSKLIEKVPIYVKLENLGESIENSLKIRAYISKTFDEEKYCEVNESIFEIEKEIEGKSYEEKSYIKNLINEIKKDLENFNVESAYRKISYLKEYLSNLSKKYNATEKIKEVEERIVNIPSNLNEEQRKILENVNAEIEEIKKNVEKGNYSIDERIKDIEYKISKIYLSQEKIDEKIILFSAFVIIVFFILVLISRK